MQQRNWTPGEHRQFRLYTGTVVGRGRGASASLFEVNIKDFVDYFKRARANEPVRISRKGQRVNIEFPESDRRYSIRTKEFHEMDERGYAPLRLYQDPETTLRIRKGNKDVEFPGDHPVFAAANRVGRKSPETLSRFWLFEFTGYSEGEYVEVCENLLPARYGVSEDLARFIGREVYRIGDVDVRDAERVAELVDSRDAATEKIHLMGKYRGGDNTLF